MSNKIKRICSLVLAIVLMLNICVIPSFAVDTNMLQYNLEVSNTTVTNDVDNTVTIAVKLAEPVFACGVGYEVSCSSGIELIGVTAIEDSSFAGFTFTNGTLYWENYVDDVPVDVELSDLGLITVKIPAGTDEGRYNVTLSGIELADASWNYPAESDTVTATIEVKEPEAPKTGFHIYYELNGKTSADDEDADKFVEYGVGDTVTADVYLVNYEKDDVYLQAYDIYLSYDRNLTYAGLSDSVGTAYKADGTEAAAADVVSHIQLVAEENVEINFPKGKPVKLGSMKFTVANTAVFDVQMPINLVPESENPEEITNIAVGKNLQIEGGDKESYYPVDVSEVKGVEVNTTYTVSYDANGGSGAPADQTKYHNQDLTLSTAEPTRDGYNFLGWTTVENPADGAAVEYAKGATYSANANDVLYAVWERNTFKVSWYNTNGNEIYSADVNAGATTSFDKTTHTEPSKEKDAQYTYTLKGWSTDSDAELNADVVDLATYKIEAETKFYPVFSTTVNTYNVYWKNEDGTVLETDLNVPYGEMPVYNGSTPTKVATVDKTFTFDKWTPGVETITGEATYTATFTESPRSYTVTYAPGEYGTINKNSETVEYGKVPADLPVVTPAAGYELIGWSDGTTTYAKDLSDYVVEGEVTLTAQYKLVEYEITLDVNGGDEITTNTWKYVITVTVTLPEATKTGATFAGWKLETAVGNWDATTYAKGDYTGKYGTVTLVAQWTNDDYTISKGTMVGGDVNLSKTTANYGEEITLTPVPAPGYNEVTYTVTDAKGNTISVENGKFTMPAGNVTVNATFTPIDYTVTVGTVTNGKVTVSQTENVHVADVITLTPAPNSGYQAVTYTVTYKDADGNDQFINVTDNKFNMPPANVTVTATFAGIDYIVKFDKDATDATGTVNEIPATFGKPIELGAGEYSRTGYTFLGWATTSGATTATYRPNGTIEDTIFTPTAEGQNVTLYAVWQVITYKITVEEPVNGSVTTNAADNEKVAYGTTVTLTAKGEEGYELDKYIVTDGNNAEVTVNDGKFTMPASDVTVKATFKAIEYNVNLDNSDTTKGTVSADVEKATIGTVVTLSNTPANGYELDGYTVTYVKDEETVSVPVTVVNGVYTFEMPAAEVTVKATFKLVQYTITFKMEDNTTIRSMEYDIEDTANLGDAENGMYNFAGWKLAEDTYGWKAGTYNADTPVTGKWGNVTLIAQWTRAAVVAVEEYQYAANGDWLICVDATDLDSSKEYQFNGESMYYTTDKNYLIDTNDTGVFYYLISGEYVEKDDQTGLNKLKDAGYELLSIETTSGRLNLYAEGDVNGDINGDKVLNIADANIIYQMVINGGGYYGDTLDIEARLKADMDTDLENQVKRGSTKDVDVVVNKINGTTATN